MLHKYLQVQTLTPFLFAWKMLIASFCSAVRLNVSFKTVFFFHLPDSAFSFAAFVKTRGDLWPGICVELVKSLGGGWHQEKTLGHTLRPPQFSKITIYCSAKGWRFHYLPLTLTINLWLKWPKCPPPPPPFSNYSTRSCIIPLNLPGLWILNVEA